MQRPQHHKTSGERVVKIIIQLKLANLASLLIVFLVNHTVYADNFKINVIYPAGVGIDSMLKSSVASVQSPDFDVSYVMVDATTWSDDTSLADYLVITQQKSPADGFFLACYNKPTDIVGEQFRQIFPKVPYVDTIAPALMAANMVSYRYAVITGTDEGKSLVKRLIKDLGIENHVRYGGATGEIFRDLFLVETISFELTTPKSGAIPDIVTLGLAATGAHNTDLLVTNIEAIVLAGCEGFLDIGVAADAQQQLTTDGFPLQVINPIKASMALLYSLIRNKVWISR